MEPAVQRQRRKAEQIRMGRGQSFGVEDIDRLRLGLAGGRAHHGHNFVIAGKQRGSDGTQQIPVVDSAKGLRLPVDAGNGHQCACDFGPQQHPVEEPRRQQWHIHRQKKIECAGYLRPAPPRCRSRDRTLDGDPAPREHGTTDPCVLQRSAVRPPRCCEAYPGPPRQATVRPAGAEPYLAPSANCGPQQVQTPQRNCPQYCPDRESP